jgi:hypothetical protein
MNTLGVLAILCMIAPFSAARMLMAANPVATPTELRLVVYDEPSWWPLGRRVNGTNDFTGQLR